MLFVNHCWINIIFLNCSNFIKFYVLFWKMNSIVNHYKICWLLKASLSSIMRYKSSIYTSSRTLNPIYIWLKDFKNLKILKHTSWTFKIVSVLFFSFLLWPVSFYNLIFLINRYTFMKQEIKKSFVKFSFYDTIIVVHFLKSLTKLQLQIKLN